MADPYDSANATGNTPADYVNVVNGDIEGYSWSAATRRPNSEGYIPIGNTSGNTGLTITFTIYAEKDGEVGIYLQFGYRNHETALSFNDIFSMTVNGVDVPSTVTMPTSTSNWAATNTYDFIAYANVKAGANTIVITVTDTGAYSGSATNGYNIYALRLSAADNKFTTVSPA